MSETRLMRNRFLRFLSVRPRLLSAAVFGVFVDLTVPSWMAVHATTRFILAFDAATALFLVLVAHMAFSSSHESMRKRAKIEDEGKFAILFLVIAAAVMSLLAIVAELVVVKDVQGIFKYLHVALVAATIALSWGFTQAMFALHYAHDYYSRILAKKPAGIEFPGSDLPDYGDFFYLSAVIGTSGQTADVGFSLSETRRIATVHCVLAFFFNTTVLALTINIASGLL